MSTNIEKKYGVILADPNWQYKTWGKATGHGRSAESYYATASNNTLAALPVAQYAAADCVLFGWATGPKLPECIAVYESWGFKYKTIGFSWVKLRKGTKKERETGALAQIPALDEHSWFNGNGHYTMANVELCLILTRGKPHRLVKNIRQLVVAPHPGEHSRKPDIYDRIERLFPGPYLELYARQKREGWDVWGNQVESDIDMVQPYEPYEPEMAAFRAQKMAERQARRSARQGGRDGR